ncbi:MAG: winged helix-turn-helix domain-containing protein [Serratia inhibens]|uniref:winged helix-turn-helix domain-containing protein n=1 Tax=Serratia inhibens TaxID=2338073 RepID=UPI003C7ED120
MKFIINKRLRFHDDNSLLEVVDDNVEPVALTGTLSRLLSLLVRNNNTLLTRDYILTHVWDDHGQTASNNNLNNYISMLRKILSSLGETDIIVTMPRQGFMFTATDINTIDGEIIANAVIPDVINNTPSSMLRKTWPKKMMLAVFVIAAVASACFASFSTDYKPLSYKNLGKIGSCNLKLVTTYHYIEHVDANLNEIGAQLASKKFNCSTPATVYYYSSKVLVGKIGKNDTMYFIAYCPQTDSKQINLQCKNLYENTHI